MTHDAARKLLLPCPFCGGVAEQHGGPGRAPEDWVQCTQCKASSDTSNGRSAEKWNARTTVSREAVDETKVDIFSPRKREPLSLTPPASGNAMREALERIVEIDQREQFTTIECDPAGNTQRIDVVDGPCAAIARAALSALTADKCEKSDGWQPIETAPKDGRTIEVKYLTDDPRKVRWSQSAYGTTWHLVTSDSAAIIKFEPTHWRPHPIQTGEEERREDETGPEYEARIGRLVTGKVAHTPPQRAKGDV